MSGQARERDEKLMFKSNRKKKIKKVRSLKSRYIRRVSITTIVLLAFVIGISSYIFGVGIADYNYLGDRVYYLGTGESEEALKKVIGENGSVDFFAEMQAMVNGQGAYAKYKEAYKQDTDKWLTVYIDADNLDLKKPNTINFIATGQGETTIFNEYITHSDEAKKINYFGGTLENVINKLRSDPNILQESINKGTIKALSNGKKGIPVTIDNPNKEFMYFDLNKVASINNASKDAGEEVPEGMEDLADGEVNEAEEEILNTREGNFLTRSLSNFALLLLKEAAHLFGAKYPHELFYNVCETGGEYVGSQDKIFGMFTDGQMMVIITLYLVLTSFIEPFYFISGQIKLLRLGAARNGQDRAQILEELVQFFITILFMFMMIPLVAFVFYFVNGYVTYLYAFFTEYLADMTPDGSGTLDMFKVDFANYNPEQGVAGRMFSSIKEQLVGPFFLLAALILMVYLNFLYAMRFINIAVMTAFLPVPLFCLTFRRTRVITSAYIQEYLSSILIMPVHASIWALYAVFFVSDEIGTIMSFVMLVSLLPVSDMIRRMIVTQDSTSRMGNLFGSMGLGMAALLMNKSLFSRVKEGDAVGSLASAGSDTAAATGDISKRVAFGTGQSQALRNVERIRQGIGTAAKVYGGIMGGVAGFAVPGAAPLGAMIGMQFAEGVYGRLGSGIAGAAFNAGANKFMSMEEQMNYYGVPDHLDSRSAQANLALQKRAVTEVGFSSFRNPAAAKENIYNRAAQKFNYDAPKIKAGDNVLQEANGKMMNSYLLNQDGTRTFLRSEAIDSSYKALGGQSQYRLVQMLDSNDYSKQEILSSSQLDGLNPKDRNLLYNKGGWRTADEIAPIISDKANIDVYSDGSSLKFERSHIVVNSTNTTMGYEKRSKADLSYGAYRDFTS